MRDKKWIKCANSITSWSKCERVNILRNKENRLCRKCIAQNKINSAPVKKKRPNKFELLKHWMIDNNFEFTFAKTNSIYIDFKNKDEDIITVKISNHQLINQHNPFHKSKKMFQSNADINLSILKNEDYGFADIEKWTFEFHNSKLRNAPDYWIPIYANFSLDKLKTVILECKTRIESEIS